MKNRLFIVKRTVWLTKALLAILRRRYRGNPLAADVFQDIMTSGCGGKPADK